MLQTLRCVNTVKRYVSLDLAPESAARGAQSADVVARILRVGFYVSPHSKMETEYSVRSNVVHVLHVCENVHETQLVADPPPGRKSRNSSPSLIGHAVHLGGTILGLLSSL